MKKEQLAEILNNRQLGSEMSINEQTDANHNGLVVVFGYSDDNVEFKGAISDECGCYGGGEILFTKEGTFYDEDDHEVLEKYNKPVTFHSIIAEYDGVWSFETKIPHATFNIYEDGDLFCKGIVFEKYSLY